jgi:hypothetical protein
MPKVTHRFSDLSLRAQEDQKGRGNPEILKLRS